MVSQSRLFAPYMFMEHPSPESLSQEQAAGLKPDLASKSDPDYAGLQSHSFASKQAEALRQTLEKHRGDRHSLAIQDFPDPDALSGAWAYKLIAQEYDRQRSRLYGCI